MRAIFLCFIAVSDFLQAQNINAQDVNGFFYDKNLFSVGLELSGAFPISNFSNVNISLPCNSTVSTGSAFELLLGYKIDSKISIIVTLSEEFYELDPSGSGVSQLLNAHPGLYQSASVLKNGQLVSQLVMGGLSYDLPLSKNGKMFLKSSALLGIIGCRIPEIEVIGYHNPGVADAQGNSLDTIETWDTPKTYAYAPSYEFGTGLWYLPNKRFSVFININYQGSSLSYTNVPVTYNLSVYSNNASMGTSATLSNYNHLKEVNPTVLYQAISIGLGCEARF